jgi:putative Mn2+ efflux pump MntP
MKTVIIPVVTLGYITTVVVVLGVVLMAEVVCWVDKVASHFEGIWLVIR